MLVAEPAGVNLALVVGSDAAVLVDAGSSPAQGRELRAVVSQVRRTVRWRPWWRPTGTSTTRSGWPGSPALRRWPTSPYALGWPRPRPPRRRTDWVFGRLSSRLRRGSLALAVAFDLGGGRRVEVAHLGRGHTEGDLVVVVPDADLVFAGDLIESAGPPSYGPDSWAHEWPATLDGLIGLMTARSPRRARSRRPGRARVRVRAARPDRGRVGRAQPAGRPWRASRGRRVTRRLGPSVRRDPARVRGGGRPVPRLRRAPPA